MARIKGMTVSNGIAVSKVVKLDDTKVKVKKESINDIKKELDLLNKAIKNVAGTIKKLKEDTIKKIGKEKAEIFEAHEQILMDPEILNKIKNMISEKKLSAPYCINEVANEQINIFKNMDDEYFKERAIDVEDIFSRLIKNILNIEIVDLTTIKDEVVIVASDLLPSQTAQLKPEYVKGIVCDLGSQVSHTAIIARSLDLPAILGLKDITKKTKNGEFIIIDGKNSVVITKPTTKEIKDYKKQIELALKEKQELKKFVNKEPITKDGKKFVIEGNVSSVKDVEKVISNGGQGVGLFRTEFIYMNSSDFPTENEQFEIYKNALQKAKGNVLTVRTLDIGGDKNLPYFKFPKEMNPFLGYRAIRMCLDKKDIFRVQLRALLKASKFGKLAIMFPMIAVVEEFKEAKKILLEEKNKLTKKGIKVANDIKIGMMMEVPSAAMNAENFAKYADFFSIGTNDLIQYSFAVDRMSNSLAYLYQPCNPSFLQLIKHIIDSAHKYNRYVAMCGEVASDEKAIPLLIGLGLDVFSMSSTSILKSKKIFSELNYSETKDLVNKALKLETHNEVINLVNKTFK